MTSYDIVYSLAGLWFGVHWSFVAIMAAHKARDDLTLYWWIHLAPLALIGWVLDFVFNWTLGFMFLDWPKPLLFSDTVQYHYSNSMGWRTDLAEFFARQLNIFDEDHIK